ncbi:MAG TPA: PspA/IM30 family protein [Pirellulales bacterium]|nr:PspA/IM30 family protein [Pirellulales bacterium]
MGIFRRAGDIVAANLNDLIDRFEEPEKMLRQAVREMDEAIETASTAAARSLAAEKLLAREFAQHERRSAEWQDRAAAAVASGDDELARRALLRRREHDCLVDALREQLTAASECNARLRRQIDAMHAKRAEARRKLATLSARHAVARARRRLQTAGAAVESSAFSRFERLREQVELAEAEADALVELSVAAASAERCDSESAQLADFLATELGFLKQSARGAEG